MNSLKKKNNSDIIELHNRPSYLKHLNNLKYAKVLYFHNDPLEMSGS